MSCFPYCYLKLCWFNIGAVLLNIFAITSISQKWKKRVLSLSENSKQIPPSTRRLRECKVAQYYCCPTEKVKGTSALKFVMVQTFLKRKDMTTLVESQSTQLLRRRPNASLEQFSRDFRAMFQATFSSRLHPQLHH